METSVVLSIAIAFIGMIVTVVSTLGGFAYHILDKKILEVKRDAKTDVDDEERRRKESVSTVTQKVDEHYENLRRDISEVKQDVKDLAKGD